MARKYLLIIGCVLGLFTSKTYSQATTILSVDSVEILATGTYGDTALVGVQVRVLDGFISDTLIGDIYYYYLTDSMMAAGDSTPVVVELDAVIDTVADPFWDIIHIPIISDEMKTGPLNLIVVWPAMVNPAVLDTDSVVFHLPIGHLGVEPEFPTIKENVIYPSPAMQYLYVRPDEINLISEMQIMNMQGQLIRSIPAEKLSDDWINIDVLNAGFYIVTLRYKDGSIISKKILKE